MLDAQAEAAADLAPQIGLELLHDEEGLVLIADRPHLLPRGQPWPQRRWRRDDPRRHVGGAEIEAVRLALMAGRPERPAGVALDMTRELLGAGHQLAAGVEREGAAGAGARPADDQARHHQRVDPAQGGGVGHAGRRHQARRRHQPVVQVLLEQEQHHVPDRIRALHAEAVHRPGPRLVHEPDDRQQLGPGHRRCHAPAPGITRNAGPS